MVRVRLISPRSSNGFESGIRSLLLFVGVVLVGVGVGRWGCWPGYLSAYYPILGGFPGFLEVSGDGQVAVEESEEVTG